MPTVNVHFNYADKSFDVLPKKQNVPPGNNGSVNWKVVLTHPDPGASVEFDTATPTYGIQFKPGQNWPGGAPVVGSDATTCSAADNNNGSTMAGAFRYSINVVVTDGNGVGTKYAHDPEIDNQGTNPVITVG